MKKPFDEDNLPPGWIKGSYENLPYYGPPLNLKDDDEEKKKPILNATAHVKIFHLSDDGEMKEYEEIMQKLADGHAMISHEQIKRSSDKTSWDVFLRWMEFRFIGPEDVTHAQTGTDNQ